MSKQPQNLPTSFAQLTSNRSQTSTLSDSCFSSSNQQFATEDEEYMVVMAKRRRSRYQVDSDDEDSNQEQNRTNLHKDLRIFQYSIVNASGIMDQLKTEDAIKRNCYFGRFGQITKIFINYKSNSSHEIQAFITYKNQLDAALAIAGLKDFKHHQTHSIRIHYGTSRYCNRFIHGHQCKKNDCCFNHSLRENHLHVNQLKNTIESQYQKVYKIIDKNLYYFVEKEYHQFKNKYINQSEVFCKCTKKTEKIVFPSIKQILRKLIDRGTIDEQKYQSVKLKIKLNNIAINKQNQAQKQSMQKQTISNALDLLSNQQVKQKKSMSSIEFRKKGFSKQQCYTAETLDQYISNASSLHNQSAIEQRIKEIQHFGGRRLSDLIKVTQCSQRGLNPQMKISDYLISKIMNKKWQYCSRFSFVSCVGKKIQKDEEAKVKSILAKLI